MSWWLSWYELLWFYAFDEVMSLLLALSLFASQARTGAEVIAGCRNAREIARSANVPERIIHQEYLECLRRG